MKHSQDKITNLIITKESQMTNRGLFDEDDGKFKHLSPGERTLLAAQYVSIETQQKDMSEYVTTYKSDSSDIKRNLSSIEFEVR